MMRQVENEGVSPVIATILMVSITVVLAAVLYVMVIQLGTDTADPRELEPLALVQQNRNTTSMIILVARAPKTAAMYDTQMSYTHDGVPGSPINATVYYPNTSFAASYIDHNWTFSENDMFFTTGMLIKIQVPAIDHGDELTITGNGYGLSRIFVE